MKLNPVPAIMTALPDRSQDRAVAAGGVRLGDGPERIEAVPGGERGGVSVPRKREPAARRGGQDHRPGQ
jgi:hypothetical protein